MLRFIGSQREGTSFFRKIGLTFWSRLSEQLLAEMVRFSFCEDDPTGTLSILGEYFCPARISRQYLQSILRNFFLQDSLFARVIGAADYSSGIFLEEFLMIFAKDFALIVVWDFIFARITTGHWSDRQSISQGKFCANICRWIFLVRKDFLAMFPHLKFNSNQREICLTE